VAYRAASNSTSHAHRAAPVAAAPAEEPRADDRDDEGDLAVTAADRNFIDDTGVADEDRIDFGDDEEVRSITSRASCGVCVSECFGGQGASAWGPHKAEPACAPRRPTGHRRSRGGGRGHG
jgi:hypothetical protein